MTSPITVPRSRNPWTQPAMPFRVEHHDVHMGDRRTVYLDDEAAARGVAAEKTLFNQPCVVESRDMATTHEVRSVALMDHGYVLWTKPFGNLESARDEFEARKIHAEKHGGAYQLIAFGQAKPLMSFAKSRD